MFESGSSQESLEAYFSREIEELGCETTTLFALNSTLLATKTSCVEGLAVTPGKNRATYREDTALNYTTNSQNPTGPTLPNINTSVRRQGAKKAKVTIIVSGLHIPPSQASARSLCEAGTSKSFPEHEFPSNILLTEGMGGYASDTDVSFHSKATSVCQARSTLTEALDLPTRINKCLPRKTLSSVPVDSTVVGAKDHREPALCPVPVVLSSGSILKR